MWTLADQLMAAFTMLLIAACFIGPMILALRAKPKDIAGVNKKYVTIYGTEPGSKRSLRVGDDVFLRRHLRGLPAAWETKGAVGLQATIVQILAHDALELRVIVDGTPLSLWAVADDVTWDRPQNIAA